MILFNEQVTQIKHKEAIEIGSPEIFQIITYDIIVTLINGKVYLKPALLKDILIFSS